MSHYFLNTHHFRYKFDHSKITYQQVIFLNYEVKLLLKKKIKPQRTWNFANANTRNFRKRGKFVLNVLVSMRILMNSLYFLINISRVSSKVPIFPQNSQKSRQFPPVKVCTKKHYNSPLVRLCSLSNSIQLQNMDISLSLSISFCVTYRL